MPGQNLANKPFPLLWSNVTPPPTVYTWDELPHIQDLAARGALVEVPLEALKATYQARLDRTVVEIEKRSSLHGAAIDAEVERLTRDLAESETLLKSTEDACDENRKALPGLRQTETVREAEVRGALMAMLGGREGYEAQHEAELRARCHFQQIEEMEHKQGIANSRAGAAQQDRAKNSEWAKRVESHARADVERVAESVQEARAACRRLQEKGLTPAVARFLVRAPLLSSAGAAILFGRLFSSYGPAPGSEVSGYFRIQQLLGAATPKNILFLFGDYSILLAAILLLIIASLLGTFLLLGRLDPLRAGQSGRRGNGGLAAAAEAVDRFSSGLLDLDISARRLRAKGRLALLRFLAFIPVAIALAIAIFFRVVTAPQPALASAPGSLSHREIYLGWLFVVSSASSGLLFWLFVLRPAFEQEPVSRRLRVFYSSLIALPLAVLAAATAWPNDADASALVLVGITAIVASTALGHGIYLQGIFSRADVVVSEQGHLREAFAQIARQPVPEDYLVVDARAPIRPPVEHARASTRVPVRPPWPFWRHKKSASETPLSVDDEIRALIKDAHVPPAVVESVNVAWKELALARSNRSSAEQEHARLEQELYRVRTRIAENLEELGRMRRFQVDVLDAHGFLILRLRTEHERIVQALQDAYAVAHASRGRLVERHAA